MKKDHVEYSVVIPVFNGEKNLEALTTRLKTVLDGLDEPYEVIFIDDNSSDRSWEILRSLRDGDILVKCFRLMRNFGQQNATMCGLRQARGRFIITMDDDLQNPPEEIPALIEEIHRGYDVVFGIPSSMRSSLSRRLGSWLAMKFYSWTFHVRGKGSAFRILRSELAKQILSYDLNYTYINGLITWFTSRISQINVNHDSRAHGKSGYTLRRLLTLSFNMITNFSLLPLQIATAAGLLFALLGFLIGTFYIVKKLMIGTPVSGFTAIIASISFFSGMILLFLGIIGEYLGRVHQNISRRPQYVIREEEDAEKNKTRNEERE